MHLCQEYNPDISDSEMSALSLRNRKFLKRHVKQEEIIAAAKVANAHEFISRLPAGYNTMVLTPTLSLPDCDV